MINAELKSELTGMRLEIIALNQSCYFFVRKMNRIGFVFQNTSREFMLEEFMALRYLENGIILHLTNLDDDSQDSSFHGARKMINKKGGIQDQKQLKTLNKKIASYRANVNYLKTKHRNKRIAHSDFTEFPRFDEFLNFDDFVKPLIQEANEIGDFIWGEPINVRFKLGKYEGALDFRESFKMLKVDIMQNQGFY